MKAKRQKITWILIWSILMFSACASISAESFLVCHHESIPDLANYQNGITEIECDQGCFTFNDVCFCREQFKWKFQETIVPIGLKCDSLSCEKDTVVNTYVPNSYCTDPEKSTIYNITSWFTEQKYENLIYIKSGDIVDVFNEVEINFAYPEDEGNTFSFDLGDGLTDTSTSPSLIHKFTRDGALEIVLNVTSQSFPSFAVSLPLFVEHPLMKAELLDCSPTYYLMHENKVVECTGYIVGSANDIDWYFSEDYQYNSSIVSSIVYSPIIGPCLYVCSEDAMRTVPNTWGAGIYHMPQQKFYSGGYLYGVELYANKPTSNFRVMVYRSSTSSIVQIYEVGLLAGHNSFPLPSEWLIEPEDTIAFYLAESDILEAVELANNVIEVFSGDDLSGTPVSSFSDITFRAEVLVITHSHFKFFISDVPTFTSSHEIFFVAHARNENKTSTSKFITIAKDLPIVHSSLSRAKAVTFEPYDICFEVENPVYEGSIETNNDSVVYFPDGVETNFNKVDRSVAAGTKNEQLYLHCETVVFQKPGYFHFNFTLTIQGDQKADAQITIHVLPSITGLQIVTNLQSNNTASQLFPVVFNITHDPFPYPLNYTWYFHGLAEENATSHSNEQTKSFKQEGIYKVSCTATYWTSSASTFVLINIPKTIDFNFIGTPTISTDDELDLELTADVTFGPSWNYTWYLGDSEDSISGGKTIKKQYVIPGVYNIRVELQTNVGVFVETFQCSVYEKITGVNVDVKAGEKSLVSHPFILAGNVSTGSDIQITWTSTDFQIISSNYSEVTVYSNTTGNHNITFSVENAVSQENVTKSISVFDALTTFSVSAKSHYVSVDSPLLFIADAKGATGRTYEIHLLNEGRTIASAADQNNITFYEAGQQSVRFDVVFGDSVSKCNELSAVLCSYTVEIHVQYPLTDLALTYINGFGEETHVTGGVMYTLVKKELSIKVLAINGTDVTFTVFLQGYSVKLADAILNGENNWELSFPLAGVIFWEVGSYPLEVTVSNGISQVKKTYTIIANEPILGLAFETRPSFIELNGVLEMSVNLASGTNVTYNWTLNNHEVITKENSFTFTIEEIGQYKLVLTASNPLGVSILNHTFEGEGPLDGPYLTCNTLYTLPAKDIEMKFGFLDGRNVNVVIKITGRHPEALISEISESFNGTYSTMFNAPGDYDVELQFLTHSNLRATKTCTVIVENVIGSSYLKILPTKMIYIGEYVTFELGVVGGLSVTGVLQVETQNNAILERFELEMKPCLYTKYSCVYGQVQYKFDVGNHYLVRGTVQNHVSSIRVTAQDLLIIGVLRGADDYLEMVAESARLGSPTMVHFMNHNSLNVFDCSIDFGDGTIQNLASVDKTLEHTYASPKEYSITLRCLSNIGVVQIQALAFVQLPLEIKELSSPQDCVLFGQSFNISIEIVDATMLSHVKHSVMINGREKRTQGAIDHDQKSLTLTVREEDYLTSGEKINMVVEITNYVSEVSWPFTVCIMKAVETVSCQTPVVWRYGTKTPFRVRADSESSYSLNLLYGDGNADTFLDIESESVSAYHTYDAPGLFEYQIQASNNVSMLWFNSTVEVVQGITNVTLVHTKSLEWPSAIVEYQLDFSGISLSDTVALEYQIYYGDGSYSGTVPITLSDISSNATLSLPPYRYKSPGCYTPTVTIRSRINSLVIASDLYISNFDAVDVVLEGEMTNMPLSSLSADEYYFKDDYLLTMKIRNTSATCYMFAVSIYNATDSLIHTQVSSEKTLLLDAMLGRTGKYKIVVKASLFGQERNVSTVFVTLLTGVPELYLIPGVKGLVHKDLEFLLATKVDPATSIKHLDWDFGDNTTLTMVPEFAEVTTYQFSLHGRYKYYMKVKHSYLNIGTYKVSVSAANNISSAAAALNVFVSNLHCERPRIEILTSGDGKVKFHYQKPITMLSSVNTDCGNMNKILYQWEMYESSQWEFDNDVTLIGKAPMILEVDMKQPSLSIPRRTLPSGYYVIKLTVQTAANGLDNSQQVFLTIVEDSMQAIISGGSLQMLPWQQDVVLDARTSKDPNEVAPTLNYEWRCKVAEITEGAVAAVGKGCFGNDEGDAVEFFGPVWTIREKTLIEGAEYTFSVDVENKAKKRKASGKQKIVLVDKAIPIIVVSCTSNCGEFVNPSNRFSLSARCTNCDNLLVSYKWSIDDLSFNLESNSLTGLTSKDLGIKASAFEADSAYTLTVEVTKSSGVSAITTYEMKTSRPPYDGQCIVVPASGITLQTSYTIKCKDWKSPVGSLNYQVLRRQDGSAATSSSYQLLKYGPQGTLSFVLSSGLEKNDFIVDLRVKITDLMDAATFYDLKAQVKTMETAESDVQSQLVNLTTGEDNVVKKLSDEGDTQRLVQLIGTITNTLNDVKVNQNGTDAVQEKEEKIEERREMRAVMAEALSEVTIQNFDNVKQTADAIGPLLQAPEEVNEKTQKLALQSMMNIADYLAKDEDVARSEDPEKIRDITTGVIKATGNFLTAAAFNSKVSGNETSNSTSQQETAQANEKSDNLTRNALKILDNVVPLLFSGKLPGEEPTRITSDTISVELSRQDSSKMQKNIETLNGGRFQLPEKLFDFGNDTVVDSKMSSLSQNPFSRHLSAKDIQAPVTSLEFTTPDNQPIGVKDLPPGNEVEFFVPQAADVETINVNSSLVIVEDILVYQLTIDQPGAAIVTRLDLPQNTSVRLYFSRGKRPTKTSHAASHLVTGAGKSGSFVFPCWTNTSRYYIGLSLVSNNDDASPRSSEFTFDLDLFVTACLYLDEAEEVWKDEGCKVGQLTTSQSTHCLCDHLTWLASSFFVPPRSLSLKTELAKLKNLDEYPALLATYCVIIGVALICMVWARRKDGMDVDNSEPTFLQSQSTSTGTTYHVAIYTGHRGGSGSTATPALIISGETLDSRALVLKNDEGRVLFKRGAVDTFIFTTEKDLGDLKYITIWHDDRGNDPSWFMSRMTITNLNQNKQYHCFCNDWLAVDQSDGKISRVLPIATDNEMQAFENIFLAKTTRDLTDGHVWFSIITRPIRSQFTRLQRVMCCLALLLSTMLTNAMFYRVDESIPVGDEIQMAGGFTIRWTNILIGIQSSLIVLPINILIVYLFRRAAPSAKKKTTKSTDNEHHYKTTAQSVLPRSHEKRKSFFQSIEQTESGGLGMNFGHHFSPHHDGVSLEAQASQSLPVLSPKREKCARLDSTRSFDDDSIFHIKQQQQEQQDEVTALEEVDLAFGAEIGAESEESLPALPKFSLSNLDGVNYWPHWVQYVAWLLCIAVSLVAGFFTLLYGLSFGKSEQEKWLFSFFISVMSDVMFNQPIKIILVAAIITLLFRKLKDEYILTEIENFRNIDWGDSSTDDSMTTKITIDEEQASYRPAPPSQSYIETTRQKRIYEAKMVDVVIEIVAYTFYLFLCLLITYGHRDPDAYAMTSNIENGFVRGKFDQVDSIPKFWDWTLNDLSVGLFDDFWYNGQLSERKGYLADGANYVLGRVRMKQVRVRKETCLANGVDGINLNPCGRHFDEDYEDTTSQYCTSWKPCFNETLPTHPAYWKYRSHSESGSYDTQGRINSYSGGGFIVEIGKSKLETDSALRYLMKNNWLDDFSRAVTVDFTVFNTQSNFYVMVMLLLEVSASGGGFNFKRILSTRLDRYSSGFAVFLGACEILFLGFSVYYLIREVKKWRVLRTKYFTEWQNWVEITSFALIWATFVLLIIRFGIVSSAKDELLNYPESFVNFESAAFIDQAYGYTLACLDFILFIKFLKLLRFNRKMSLMFKTVTHASVDTKYFSVSFVIVMGAFAQFAHLVFLTSVFEYSRFVYTLESLLNMLLGSFNFDALIQAAPILGRVFFFCYFIFMVFIILNMFISIVNESFAIVREETRTRKNKYELIDFLKQRITGFLPHFMTRKKRKADSDPEKPGCESVDNNGVLAVVEKQEDLKAVHFQANDDDRGLTPLEKCKLRVDRCEAILDALEKAIDQLSMRVEDMIVDENAEDKLWEYMVELVRIKRDLPQLLNEVQGRGKQKAVKSNR